MTDDDPSVGSDTDMAGLAEQMHDQYGIDLTGQYGDGSPTLAELAETAQHNQATGESPERHDPSGQGAGATPHAISDSVAVGGEMVGSTFVATGDWSGGVVEDVPRTEGGDVGPFDDPVPNGGEFGDGYESGFLDGYDSASSEFENAMNDDPGLWE
ncbi:MAG: hypothetical protein JWO79_1844 [Actinomycetia bacterium]|nr:hypothetical protein [Actinomycetes bacterium]